MNLAAYVRIIRPRQWLKNLMVLFPPFLSGAVFQPGLLARGIVPFIAFCLASSATYLINDLLDADQDASHPRKCQRPIPSGAVSRRSALFLGLLLAAASVVLGLWVGRTFLLFLGLYLGISWAYSWRLKQLPIVDVFCIAFGFVLRLYGGGEAFGVLISDWLFLTVFLLAVFLSVGKRLSEMVQLGADAIPHRPSLAAYPEGFLESAMYLTGAAVLVTYALYAITTPLMVYTVPLCLLGLLRYMLLVRVGGEGDPTDALLRDGMLLTIGLLWALLVGLSIYL